MMHSRSISARCAPCSWRDFLNVFHNCSHSVALYPQNCPCILREIKVLQASEVAVQGRLESLIAQMRAGGIFYREAVCAFEKAYICAALRENAGSMTKAASALGLHRNTLSRLCYEFQVDARSFRPARRRPPKSATETSAVKESAR